MARYRRRSFWTRNKKKFIISGIIALLIATGVLVTSIINGITGLFNKNQKDETTGHNIEDEIVNEQNWTINENGSLTFTDKDGKVYTIPSNMVEAYLDGLEENDNTNENSNIPTTESDIRKYLYDNYDSIGSETKIYGDRELILVESLRKYGFVDVSNLEKSSLFSKIDTPKTFENINIAKVYENNKRGYLNLNTLKASEMFDVISDPLVYEGLVLSRIYEGNKSGYLNLDTLDATPMFDELKDPITFSNQVFVYAKSDNKSWYLNLNNFEISPEFNTIANPSVYGKLLLAKTYGNNTQGFINLITFEEVIPCIYKSVEIINEDLSSIKCTKDDGSIEMKDLSDLLIQYTNDGEPLVLKKIQP